MASFTITQPFLGAPLQFQPALGSKELECLIDNFVTGSMDKQTKLSQVTMDFFLNATVDINTGSLVKVYNVWMPIDDLSFDSFDQSPTTSQTSGFSPAVYTPASSTGSFSTTPVSSSTDLSSRQYKVSKKATSKVTKKTAEMRLPGFQIMTRDGVDVTSSAGRGTKTKEQREHAHLMRIMKACPDCKKKKVRCDPSHRRSATEMSRSSTSSTSSCSSRQKRSPSASMPSITIRDEIIPFFSPSNPMDDFVLYPEGSSLFANSSDLSQFNFDITSTLNDQSTALDFQDYCNVNNYQFFDSTFDNQFADPMYHHSMQNDELSNQDLIYDDLMHNDQLSNQDPISDDLMYHDQLNTRDPRHDDQRNTRDQRHDYLDDQRNTQDTMHVEQLNNQISASAISIGYGQQVWDEPPEPSSPSSQHLRCNDCDAQSHVIAERATQLPTSSIVIATMLLLISAMITAHVNIGTSGLGVGDQFAENSTSLLVVLGRLLCMAMMITYLPALLSVAFRSLENLALASVSVFTCLDAQQRGSTSFSHDSRQQQQQQHHVSSSSAISGMLKGIEYSGGGSLLHLFLEVETVTA